MDDLTPHQLVKTSLDALRRAASMLGGEEHRIVVSGIEKAAALLDAVAPAISGGTVVNAEQAVVPVVYKPEIFDVDAMLQPIPGDNPSGGNARVSGEVNSLLGLVVNRTRSADFRPQYHELFEKAKKLLIERSKDLGVAVRLTEAATEISGFAGVADGLFLINGMFSGFWDGLYPEMEDDDCEPRANELTKLQELLTVRLHARYGAPHEYTPNCADLAAAERESAIFRAIAEQLDILDKTTFDLFGDQSPDLSELRSFLKTFQNRTDALYDTFRQSLRQERDAQRLAQEQAIAEATDAADREAQRQQTTQKGGPESGGMSPEPKDPGDAAARIDICARYLVANDPRDPLGYMVNRTRKWFSRISGTAAVSPPEERRRIILDAFSSQQWEEVLRESETLFSAGAYRWIDLQRYQAAAAEGMGSDYAIVARMIVAATVDYVAANRGLLDEKLDDGTPCASPETIEWIRMEIANRGSGRKGGGFGGKSEAFFASEIERANDLAAKGRAGAGMSLLHSRLQQATCRREQFLWRIALTEFCFQNGMMEIALAAIDNIVETIDKLNLTDWEDPELFAHVYKTGYAGCRSVGGKNTPSEKLDYFYRRICLYDPKQTIASEN